METWGGDGWALTRAPWLKFVESGMGQAHHGTFHSRINKDLPGVPGIMS